MRIVAMLSALLLTGASAMAQQSDIGTGPGRLIDVGGRKLHLNCIGSGSPTVVLEAGASSFAIDWSLVQPEIARTQRVCSYDRAVPRDASVAVPSRGPQTGVPFDRLPAADLYHLRIKLDERLIASSPSWTIRPVTTLQSPCQGNTLTLRRFPHDARCDLGCGVWRVRFSSAWSTYTASSPDTRVGHLEPPASRQREHPCSWMESEALCR